MVGVVEGNSVTISCTSTGAPTPNIVWEFNNKTASFVSADNVTNVQAGLVRNSMDDIVPEITLGRITSSITILVAQYPDHDGVYTCIGSNDKQMINTSDATVTLQVVGKIDYTSNV